MTQTPKFSVVIPAYNQAGFLAQAVESVLAQTFRDFEIIVVDDGSTDDTPAVASGFGEKIRYIRQENRGLAGARNSGLRAAQGEYVGLLDSDDIWLPGYIEQMMKLAEQNPATAVFTCVARCIAADGQSLPQVMGYHPRAQANSFELILRSNYIIPSTACLQREKALQIGLFDGTLPSGCEDWDLWLRYLAQGETIHSIPDALVLYRIHGSSLSASTGRMQLSKRKVVEKHFGADDGQYAQWPALKRKAYAAYYRYEVITSVLWAGDWNHADAFRKACAIEPETARDQGFFYELALGSQPKGLRGTAQQIDLAGNAARVARLLEDVFGAPGGEGLAQTRGPAFAAAYRALSLAAYNTRQYGLSRKFALQAARYNPRVALDRLLAGNFIKSLLGRRALDRLRSRRPQAQARLGRP